MEKMMKKIDRKKLVKEADKYFSLYIRNRDKRCVCCGTSSNLQCGHLFSRAAYSTRWDECNAFAQCSSCNLRHEYDSYPLTAYFLDLYGRDAYDELHRKHKMPTKITNSDLQEIIEKYKKQTGVEK